MAKIPQYEPTDAQARVGAPREAPSFVAAPQVDTSALAVSGRAEAASLEALAKMAGQPGDSIMRQMETRDRLYNAQAAEMQAEEERAKIDQRSAKALTDTFDHIGQFGAQVARVGEALFHAEQEAIASTSASEMRKRIQLAIAKYQDNPNARGLPDEIAKLATESKLELGQSLEGRAAMRFGVVADNLATEAYTHARGLERQRIFESAKAADAVYVEEMHRNWLGATPDQRKGLREELMMHHQAQYQANLIAGEELAARLLKDDQYFATVDITEAMQRNPSRVYKALSYVRDHPRGNPASAPAEFQDVVTRLGQVPADKLLHLTDAAHAKWKEDQREAEHQVRMAHFYKGLRQEQGFERGMKEGWAPEQWRQATAEGKVSYAQGHQGEEFSLRRMDVPPDPNIHMQARRRVIEGNISNEEVWSLPLPAKQREELAEELRRGDFRQLPEYRQAKDYITHAMGGVPGMVDRRNRELNDNRTAGALQEFDDLVKSKTMPPRAAAQVTVAKFQALDLMRFKYPYLQFGDWRTVNEGGVAVESLALTRQRTEEAYRSGVIGPETYRTEMEKMYWIGLAEERRQRATPPAKPGAMQDFIPKDKR